MSIEEKKSYIQANIIDRGHNLDDFLDFLSSRTNALDIELVSIKELAQQTSAFLRERSNSIFVEPNVRPNPEEEPEGKPNYWSRPNQPIPSIPTVLNE